ncbi:unnamed protein product [Vitrella brassicaformis CCMP3155]|uniref:Uncharacterized protein n=1 Tax=Vitrella brassicaformis (strain CCMP3155) TaxID=1169540 RepID=A0A0G4H8Q6_VITBC|nr:unnamed protein product [Vitrella brassicaformis CCMP3155]|eukprot:CEM40079.1 unnamed protein product [Vitrella brassicaformis CCMP3155]
MSACCLHGCGLSYIAICCVFAEGTWKGQLQAPFAQSERGGNISCIYGLSDSSSAPVTFMTIPQHFTVNGSDYTISWPPLPSHAITLTDTSTNKPLTYQWPRRKARQAEVINFFDHTLFYQINETGSPLSYRACENFHFNVRRDASVRLIVRQKYRWRQLVEEGKVTLERAHEAQHCSFLCDDEEPELDCVDSHVINSSGLTLVSHQDVYVQGEFECSGGSCLEIQRDVKHDIQHSHEGPHGERLYRHCLRNEDEPYQCTPCMQGDGICDCGCFLSIFGWDHGDCLPPGSMEGALRYINETLNDSNVTKEMQRVVGGIRRRLNRRELEMCEKENKGSCTPCQQEAFLVKEHGEILDEGLHLGFDWGPLSCNAQVEFGALTGSFDCQLAITLPSFLTSEETFFFYFYRGLLPNVLALFGVPSEEFDTFYSFTVGFDITFEMNIVGQVYLQAEIWFDWGAWDDAVKLT